MHCITYSDTTRGLVTLLFGITELYATIHSVYKCYLTRAKSWPKHLKMFSLNHTSLSFAIRDSLLQA